MNQIVTIYTFPSYSYEQILNPKNIQLIEFLMSYQTSNLSHIMNPSIGYQPNLSKYSYTHAYLLELIAELSSLSICHISINHPYILLSSTIRMILRDRYNHIDEVLMQNLLYMSSPSHQQEQLLHTNLTPFSNSVFLFHSTLLHHIMNLSNVNNIAGVALMVYFVS
jgi:hypothetical protein